MVTTRRQQRRQREEDPPESPVQGVQESDAVKGCDGSDGLKEEFASLFVTWNPVGGVAVEEVEDEGWFVSRPPPLKRQRARVFL
jgi:hypothetical protein